MTHDQYLERYHEMTSKALSEIALLHGKEEWEEAAAYLTALRQAQDKLWDQFRAQASAGVKP